MSDANMSDDNSILIPQTPCAKCDRTDCTGCLSAPVFLTTPFFVGEPYVGDPKVTKKPSWIEKQQKRRGWKR